MEKLHYTTRAKGVWSGDEEPSQEIKPATQRRTNAALLTQQSNTRSELAHNYCQLSDIFGDFPAQTQSCNAAKPISPIPSSSATDSFWTAEGTNLQTDYFGISEALDNFHVSDRYSMGKKKKTSASVFDLVDPPATAFIPPKPSSSSPHEMIPQNHAFATASFSAASTAQPSYYQKAKGFYNKHRSPSKSGRNSPSPSEVCGNGVVRNQVPPRKYTRFLSSDYHGPQQVPVEKYPSSAPRPLAPAQENVVEKGQMDQEAVDCAKKAFELHSGQKIPVQKFIRQHFNATFGGEWKCVVGNSFKNGSTRGIDYMTYFKHEEVPILLFKMRENKELQ